MFPGRGWLEVDWDRSEAPGLDLHHAVDGPEGRTRHGEDFNDAIPATPVLNLDLESGMIRRER